jgi:hypothetical protein
MAYVAIGILFLLVLGAGIIFFVMAQTKDSAAETGADDSADKQSTPFSGPDQTPVGDTSQHAGQQDEEGQTVTPNDAERVGGTGGQTSGPRSAGHAPSQEPDEPAGGRFKRDPIGGEAEAEPTLDVGEVPHPRGT